MHRFHHAKCCPASLGCETNANNTSNCCNQSLELGLSWQDFDVTPTSDLHADG
jgi:hypothetical protein